MDSIDERGAGEGVSVTSMPVPGTDESQSLFAYRALRHLVRTGRFRPDELVSEQQLTAEVGVGRTPVRDAVARLEHEGLLERLPKRGVRIRSLTIEELRDLYQAREWLELMSVRTAIDTLTDDDLGAIDQVLARAHDAVDAGCSWLDYRDLDREFHSSLWRATKNQRVYDMLESLHDAAILDSSFNKGMAMPEQGRVSLHEHAQILEALKIRDLAAAEKAVVDHARSYQVTLANRIFGPGRWTRDEPSR